MGAGDPRAGFKGSHSGTGTSMLRIHARLDRTHGLCLWVLCILGKTDQLRSAGIVGLLGECLVSTSLVKYWASFNASDGRRMAAKNRLRSTSAPDRRALMNAMKFPVTASTAVSSGASCGTRGLFESLPDVWTAWQWCSTTLQPRSPSHAANTMHPSTGPARTGNALSWGCPRFFYSRGFAWRYWRLSPACWPLGSTFTHTRPPHNTASEA